MERIALAMFKVENHSVFRKYLVVVGQIIALVPITHLHQLQIHNQVLLVYQINTMIQVKNNVLMNKVGVNQVLIVGCMILVHNVLHAQLLDHALEINLVHNKLIVQT